MRWIAAAIVLMAAMATAGPTARAEVLPEQTDRVVGLAKLWAKVKFFHPYLAYKDIDWDAALIAALPRVEAATTVADYRAALQEMLAALGDPATKMQAGPAPEPAKVAPADWLSTPAAGVVAVRIEGLVVGFDYDAIRAKAAQLTAEVTRTKAKVLVIDMRAPGADPEYVTTAIDALQDVLPAIEEWPQQRRLQHRGFRTQDGTGADGYFTAFLTTGARPQRAAGKSAVARVVFVVDANSVLPAVAIALQATGRAVVVAHGVIEGRGVETARVDLPGDLRAQVRLGESLWGPTTADVMVSRDADLTARALTVASGLLAASLVRPRPRAMKQTSLPALRVRDDLDYADQPYPTRERRMLAGIRMWAVLEYFFPYRYLIEDWNSALRDFVYRLADAGDQAQYLRMLRQMSVRAGDGHIYVRPAQPAPRGWTALVLRRIEGKLAVAQVLDGSDAKQQRIAVGDVVESIAGKPAGAAFAEARAEQTGSNDEFRDQRTALFLLAGDDRTTVKLGVRGADGKLRDVEVTRAVANRTALFAYSTAPHWKRLPGNIGYVDLRELMIPEVEMMMEALKDTTAIVFDMRGYPNGTVWPIAPRVNTRKAKYGTQVSIPLVGADDSESSDSRYWFLQKLPELPSGAPIYRGKIVVLIDDRAISHAEHSCLFLRETAGPTFIGSPTAGANGNVTTMRLPGGLRMSFTGLEVRHADGKQLQKLGIQPDVLVRPTVAGLRAGKDEVLDRALAWLATGR